MRRLRLFLVGLIAPCQCRATYSTGELFEWMEVDASKCRRWGHEDATRVVGMR